MHTSESVTQYNSVENADESRLITWMDAPWLIFIFLQLWFFLRMGQNSWQKCNCLLCLSHQSDKWVSDEEDHLLSSSIWAHTAVSSKGATESVKAQTTGCPEQDLRNLENRRVHTQTLKWHFRKTFLGTQQELQFAVMQHLPFKNIYSLFLALLNIMHVIPLLLYSPCWWEIFKFI